MQTARISEIQRQKDHELKTAVEHAAEGRVTQSLAHIKHVEYLKEPTEPTERHRAIVNDYIQLTEPERRETLIVAGTNEARREINRMVRESLNLTGKGREFETLTRVDLTQAQRRFAPSYQPGMVIQPEKDYQKAGLTRGARLHELGPGAAGRNRAALRQEHGTSDPPRTPIAAPRRRYATQRHSRRQAGVPASAARTPAQAARQRPASHRATAASTKSG